MLFPDHLLPQVCQVVGPEPGTASLLESLFLRARGGDWPLGTDSPFGKKLQQVGSGVEEQKEGSSLQGPDAGV